MAQDIAEKVALLLAKAEGTDNPLEAEAYTRKAEELMLKHGIDEAMAAAKRPGAKVDPIVIERVRVKGQYRMALVTYGPSVGWAFSVKSYKSEVSKNEQDIWLVGHRTDVDQAATLVRSLLIQAPQALDYWWRTEGAELNPAYNTMNQYLAKREFLFAFGSGVRERLREIHSTAVKAAGTGAELVLVDRSKVVDGWIKENLTFGKARGKSLKGGTMSAARAGHAAGREAVGQKQVR
jgi:hypothetical protein